ncbi:hypothetical protein [Methylobacterium indicum]|uniref:Uncharacterized protein n=1 Tax=Methylobacterium indicum TaxID=1775910 RepID=A0A8H9C6Q2_9HYPH|nr:hypothetical protein [Methylobacterium indicum]BCM83600.1 hypothetical protein mvi_20610 [Methylobacterium indicum]
MRLAEFNIAGRGLPAGSARGVQGTIGLVKNGVVVRMGGGVLRDMTRESARKFKGIIECEDLRGAPLFGLWIGSRLTVDYLDFVEEPINQPQVRPHVPGSLHFLDAAGFEVPQAQGVQRRYQPRFELMITAEGWEMRHDPWAASVKWSFPWEEV